MLFAEGLCNLLDGCISIPFFPPFILLITVEQVFLVVTSTASDVFILPLSYEFYVSKKLPRGYFFYSDDNQ